MKGELPQIGLQTSGQYISVNDNLFAMVPVTSGALKKWAVAGLTIGLLGGAAWTGAAWTTWADTDSVVLTGSTKNYVERDLTTGVVTANAAAFTAGKQRLYTFQTTANGIDYSHADTQDYRSPVWQEGRAYINNLGLVVGGAAPTTGWYSPSAGIVRTPNSVTIDGNLTVSGGTITTGSATALSLATTGGTGLVINNLASIVNAVNIFGSADTNPVAIRGSGTSTNVGITFQTKGSGAYSFSTDVLGGNVEQVRITHTASATRYITLTGSNGGDPTLGVSGGNLAITPNVVMAGTLTVNGASITAGAGFVQAGARNQFTSSGRISVSTATTIFSIVLGGSSVGRSGALLLVNGYEIATPTNTFLDVVSYQSGQTPVVGFQSTTGASARTYTSSGTTLQLAMASGTYNVSSSWIEQAN